MERALVTPDAEVGLSGHHSHIGSFAPATKITISSNFFSLSLQSGSRIVRMEARYATFNGKVSREEAITAIVAADTYLPYAIAGLSEIAAFGAQFPREQEKGPIIGLELVPTDYEHYGIACLSTYGEKRRISITAQHDDWPANTKFLILRPW